MMFGLSSRAPRLTAVALPKNNTFAESLNPTWKKMLQKKPILNKNRRKSKMSKF